MSNDWKNDLLTSWVEQPTMGGFTPIKLSLTLEDIGCPFYGVIEHGSFITQKACNHPNILDSNRTPGPDKTSVSTTSFQIKIQYGTGYSIIMV
jgi:hypothetical protein